MALERENYILFRVNHVPGTVLGTLFYPQEVRIVRDYEIQNESGSFVFLQGFVRE